MRIYLAVLLLLIGGCTSNSTKLALEASGKVQQTRDDVVDNYNIMLRHSIYNEMLAQLDLAKNVEERNRILNDAWNKRDQMEFLQVQWERARAMYLLTVETKIWSQESQVDLFLKRGENKK